LLWVPLNMVGEEGLEPPHVKTSAIYSRDLAVEDFIKPCLRSRASIYSAIPRNIKGYQESLNKRETLFTIAR
jgi:hypothetical protein